MKHLFVSVAGLGWHDIEKRGCAFAGFDFSPVQSVFPAVTCTAQATLRTGLLAREHGMISNGWFSRDLRRPFFWEQSSALVSGTRIWDEARSRGATVSLLFLQQSLGEVADFILSPAHVHKHGGGSILFRNTKPESDDSELAASNGAFPLWRYWGPLASPKAGDAVLRDALWSLRRHDPDIAFVYLPTLDYEAQRFGPDDPRNQKPFDILETQLAALKKIANSSGASFTVAGEYAIAPVTTPPVFPNKTLLEAGLFKTRSIKGRLYADMNSSRAFAMVDHEIAHVFVRDPSDVEEARAVLSKTDDYEAVLRREPDQEWAHPNAGELLLVAKEGSWCAYPWWERKCDAPDFATHIDIHNKPGFDPSELFFDRKIPFPPSVCQDHTRIGGTHGRKRPVAVSSTLPLSGAQDYAEFVRAFGAAISQ